MVVSSPADQSSVILDPRDWPETSEYLGRLDGRVDAHPECRTRAVFLRDLATSFPELAAQERLPGVLRAALMPPADDVEWVPTVSVVTMLTMVRDRVYADDDEFRMWNFQRQLRLYQTPLFRAVIQLVSPSLLVKGGSRRWRTFQTGSKLKVSGGKGGVELRVDFPRRLYSRAYLVSLVASFSAAFEASRAEEYSVELVEFGDERARYRARWR